MTIAIDFDGTVVDFRYPKVGAEVPNAVRVMKRLVASGFDLVLFTVRSGHQIGDAVDWFKSKDIPLSGVQYSKGQQEWSWGNKCHADLYIDDAAFGCPLIVVEGFSRPCVDWLAVEKHFFG